MEGTTRTRAGVAVSLGALAGCFALAVPADAAVTHAEITSPQGPFFSVYDSAAASNPQFDFSGTSDGTSGDAVDIRCYTSGYNYSTLVGDVSVNADGTFSTGPVDLGNVYDNNCRFRALPAGVEPNDLSPFTGPYAGVSESDQSTLSGGPNDGTQYDFFADLWQRSGHVEYDGVSDCGLSSMQVLTPMTRQSYGYAWSCSAQLGGEDNVTDSPGRSNVEVDGQQAYGSDAASNLFSSPSSADNSGFPALTSSVSQDGTSGDGTITETENFVICPPSAGNYPANSGNCSPAFNASGVKLKRTITQTDGGQTAKIADEWSSTDGATHVLKLHYDNGEDTCCGDPEWAWAGGEPGGYRSGDVVDGLPAAQSVIGRVSQQVATSADWPALALTWDTAPKDARLYDSSPYAMRFLLDYDVAVPATGSKTLRFVYQGSASTDGVTRLATRARDAFGAPTVTITAPANGSTVGTPTVSVGGTALDNVGVTQLVVNGTSVTPAADGTYSVPVSLTTGANTLTATVKDAAGNTASATSSVTYTPKATPAAVRCVVPSVKRGSKVSTVKALLTKANCRTGRLVQRRSSKVKKGRVISLVNSPGITFPKGQKLQIIVSSGKKKHKK